MKRLLLASTALAFGGQAFAADMPIKAPRLAAPVAYSWSSCYVGGHVGAGRSRTDFIDQNGPATATIGPQGSSIDVTGRFGGLGGVQVGCDYQFNSGWVIGFAGDFSWANIQGQAIDPFFNGKNGGPLTLTSRTDRLASATGRIGYAWDRLLVYGKGGAAWAHDRYSLQNLVSLGGAFCFDAAAFFTACNSTATTTRRGWTVGGGIEWAFANNWSAMIEYDHYGFGTKTIPFGVTGGTVMVPLDIKQNIDVVKVGINYRFGMFGN